MPDKKYEDRLAGYIEVKDRIAKFYDLFGQGRLVTGEVRLTSEPDGVPRVMVQGLAYRNPEDLHPAVGWSWMVLPGTTPYTRGSELENAETSAWGRAIAALGILIDKSIASANEIDNKADTHRSAGGFIETKNHPIDTTKTPEGGLIGTAIAQGNHDFNLRQTPEGWVLPFRVKNGSGSSSFIVRAVDGLAEALDAIKATVIDQRVQVWGTWQPMTTPAKGTKPAVNYRILVLERISTPDGILPAPAFDTADRPPGEPADTENAASYPLFDDLEGPPDDVPLLGEKAS